MDTLWIDALEFDDYGGFTKDTQFVREMGQGYLMADGIGTPVKPASVKFEVEEDGWHRFFIRTKNWCAGYDPDGLILAVDGVKYDHICGKMQTQKWYFEVAADFELTKGRHTLEVYDTEGWFGRFAAIVITNDYDFTPSPDMQRWKQQRAEMKGLKKSVTDHGHFDLLIAGGGIPAVVASVTAAQKGMKVAVLSDRPVLGGNASIEANVSVGGGGHHGYLETGLIYRIQNVRQERRCSWTEALEEFVAQEPNISLFRNMLMDDAVCDGTLIRSVHGINTLDLSEHTFSADLFIDDTGDGWLGYYAGADYHIGRESKIQYQEEHAPDAADLFTMSGCNIKGITKEMNAIGYLGEFVDEEVSYTPPAWAFKMLEGDEMNRTPHQIYRGDWWVEDRGDVDDLWDAEYARDSMIRMNAGYYGWLKNSWTGREKSRNLKLLSFSTFNAKRESRRLIGDYITTENDYIQEPVFEDAVCHTAWRMDTHHPMGIYSGKEGAFYTDPLTPVSPFPFRCLYSKNVDNLLLAGRSVSVSHMALGTARVSGTCAVMAQAVGTAAVLCKKYHQTPREIGKFHIDELQQQLLKDGQYIPHVFNHDPDDLARTAEVTADSWNGENTPDCVINGKTRATDGEPHAWISQGKLPQSLVLTLAEPKKIHEVRLTLEIPFDRFHGGGMDKAPTLDEMLKDFSVDIQVNGKWKCVGKIENNIHRLVVVDFPTETAAAVRINAIQATGIDYAIIPEVRIY